MSIKYYLADLHNTYTMYNPPDVRWHVLNNTMSQYHLHYYQIFGLNGVTATAMATRHNHSTHSHE